MIKLSCRAIMIASNYANKYGMSIVPPKNSVVFDDIDNSCTVYTIKAKSNSTFELNVCVAQYRDNRFTKVLGIAAGYNVRYILYLYLGSIVRRLNKYMWFTVPLERYGNAQLYLLKDKILHRIDYDPSCNLDQFVAESNIFTDKGK